MRRIDQSEAELYVREARGARAWAARKKKSGEHLRVAILVALAARVERGLRELFDAGLLGYEFKAPSMKEFNGRLRVSIPLEGLGDQSRPVDVWLPHGAPFLTARWFEAVRMAWRARRPGGIDAVVEDLWREARRSVAREQALAMLDPRAGSIPRLSSAMEADDLERVAGLGNGKAAPKLRL